MHMLKFHKHSTFSLNRVNKDTEMQVRVSIQLERNEQAALYTQSILILINISRWDTAFSFLSHAAVRHLILFTEQIKQNLFMNLLSPTHGYYFSNYLKSSSLCIIAATIENYAYQWSYLRAKLTSYAFRDTNIELSSSADWC